MPRQAKPADLNLQRSDGRNPEAASYSSSPINVDIATFGGDFGATPRLDMASLNAMHKSPPTSPRLGRDSPRMFFGGSKNRAIQEPEDRANIRQIKDQEDVSQSNSSSVSKVYNAKKNAGSTPELSLVGSAESGNKTMEDEGQQKSFNEAQSYEATQPGDLNNTLRRKDRAFRNPLGRTKSRSDSKSKSDEPRPNLAQPPKTAPLAADWPGSDMRMLQANTQRDRRGKSAERAVASESDDNASEGRGPYKEKEKSSFISGGRHVVSKAKTGGGNFLTRLGKMARSSSSHEKEVPDSEYVLKIINKPLVEQTRITRISKDLGSCRDKTEYWMPSLPWRCIDYLNLNCETEGLYRVPGSGPQVKMWQRRFDTELDVDLLDEKELYDPNNISSMLKSWLRELPSEIMPADIQSTLATELELANPEYQKLGQPAPQRLRDTLSELPPFNYYLLFAITCHLSLLLSHKDKNKMDLNNLSICIGPCLKMERWLFNYLVGDWRHCWQGCFTEKEYLEKERAYEAGRESLPQNNGGMQNLNIHDRAASSRGSTAQHEDTHSLRSAEYRLPESSDGGNVRRTQLSTSDGKRVEMHHPDSYSYS